MDEKKAAAILKKQYDRQNEFIKNNYERVNLLVPIGTKQKIKAAAGEGVSVNAWINNLIIKALNN